MNGRIFHNSAGELVVERWSAIPARFPTVGIDTFVVMPDHVHGILFTGFNPEQTDQPITIGDVIRWFKTSTQSAYRQGVENREWPAYDRHLWQRGFHDRIIRTDAELVHIQRYIEGNPGRWWARQINDLDMGQT